MSENVNIQIENIRKAMDSIIDTNNMLKNTIIELTNQIEHLKTENKALTTGNSELAILRLNKQKYDNYLKVQQQAETDIRDLMKQEKDSKKIK